MAISTDFAEQNIITIQDGEQSFFEEFTKMHSINWSFEEKKNNILPLSKSYVGYITTPNRVISLKPKYNEIGFEHIIRLYLYVYGYRPTDSAAILDVSNAETSADVADMFIQNLRRNVQEGIIRTYDREPVHTTTLKGRVNYTKTYLGAMMRKRKYVDTKVSILSLKNDYNNLILTALKKLKHISKFAAEATELSMYFDGAASDVSNGSELLERINFNSNTARYRRTLTYAAMIIDQLSYSDCGSTVGTDSFLINFDRLFEDFVAKVLKEIPEKKEFSTWANKRKFADVIGINGKYEEREYQPDIIYRYISEDEKYDYMPTAYAVLDVKNKAYGQFKNADIYQMLTYVRLLHGKKAILLYPSFHKRMPETLSLDSSVFEPSTITACFVNIADESGAEFLKSIRWFAETVVNTIWEIPVK
jgi:5-methylcytosine-specific restriction enzyme subunit McrC